MFLNRGQFGSAFFREPVKRGYDDPADDPSAFINKHKPSEKSKPESYLVPIAGARVDRGKRGASLEWHRVPVEGGPPMKGSDYPGEGVLEHPDEDAEWARRMSMGRE